MENIQPVRLIVTGQQDGRSYIASDAPASGALVQPHRPTALTDLWHVLSVPADVRSDGRADEGRPFTLSPDGGGIVFRFVQFDPYSPEDVQRVDGSAIFEAMNAGAEHVGGSISPFMHRTATLDFAIVLRGVMTMLLDSESTEVGVGDVIVQRATNHAWENRGTEPAMIAFILIDAAPPTDLDVW